jgi:hypothetical protein
MTATTMFAEPDFRPYFTLLLQLLVSMSQEIQQKIQVSALLVRQQLSSLNMETLSVKNLGTCSAHRELDAVASRSLQALGYVELSRLEKRANSALRAMDASTTVHELIDILAFYHIDEALLRLLRGIIQDPNELEYLEKHDRFVSVLEQLESEREVVARKELLEHKALFDTVSSLLIGLGTASPLGSVLMSARLSRVHAKTSGTRFLSVREIREDALFAQQFLQSFTEEFVRCAGDVLYFLSSDFKKKYFQIEIRRRMDSKEQSEFMLCSIARIAPLVSKNIPDVYVILSDILMGLKQKTYTLSLREKHGLGAYWNVRFQKHASSRDTEIVCNIPHRVERGVFGISRHIPFEEKDGLTLSVLYPALLVYFEKHQHIVNALRSARLDVVSAQV